MLIGSLGLLSSGAGAAPELFVSLDYQIDPALAPCPSEEAFRRSVSEQLGYDPFRDEAPHRVVARARAATPGSEGLLRWLDANGAVEGERLLTSATPSCDDLVREMAFAVVVQIQLFIAAAPPEPAPTAIATAAPGPAPPPPPPAPAPAATRPRHRPRAELDPDAQRPWSGSAGLGAFVAYGLSPKVTGWGRLFGEARYRSVSLELGAETSLPWEWRQSDGTGFTGQIALGTLSPCLHAHGFRGCPVAKVGVVRIQGVGVDEVRSPTGPIAQAGLRVGAALAAGRHFTCTPRVEALGTLTHLTVELNGVGVWTTPAATVLGGIDVAYRF